MLFIEKAKADKATLLQKWVDMLYCAYPLGSSGFVRTSKDNFTNPIGFVTQTSLNILYDAIIGDDVDPAKVSAALTELVQLRAIQNMTPSKAVGPLTQLKSLLKQEVLSVCMKENKDSKMLEKLFDEYFIVDTRIDTLFLMALDLYSGNREKVFNLRVEEIHRSQSQVVRWAKMREEKLKTNHNTEG